jgi:hypothetical protein
MHHYTYRITNIKTNKHYYGSRKSALPPYEDLGVQYFSSSSDDSFLQEQKDDPTKFKYKVLLVSTPEKCISLESKLHQRFDVDSNPAFYNKAKQTSTKFTTCNISSYNKDQLLYDFMNLSTKEIKRTTMVEMEHFLNDKNVRRLKSDCKTVKGWTLVNKSQKSKNPKTTDILFNETHFHFVNTDTGESYICTPKELCDRLGGIKPHYLNPLIYGETSKYKNIMLHDTYKKSKKPKNAPALIDTKFLFKTLDGKKEEYETPRNMIEKYPYLSLSNLLTMVQGGILSSMGWCMGWYKPFPEKIEGNHNKFNNKDLKSYTLVNIITQETITTDRLGIKTMLNCSSSAISMLINRRITKLKGFTLSDKQRTYQ